MHTKCGVYLKLQVVLIAEETVMKVYNEEILQKFVAIFYIIYTFCIIKNNTYLAYL